MQISSRVIFAAALLMLAQLVAAQDETEAAPTKKVCSQSQCPGTCAAAAVNETDFCQKSFNQTMFCAAVIGADLNKCAVPAQGQDYICSGVKPGNCPTRGTWSGDFYPPGVICAYTTQEDTTQCIDESVCETQQVNSVTYKGIWQCWDSRLACVQAPGPVTGLCKNCLTNNNTQELCSGHGSCVAPQFDAKGSNYACVCEPNWTGKKCEKPVNNNCDFFGGCGDKGKCDKFNNTCICNAGYKGDQCILCTSDKVCNNAANPSNKCNKSTGRCECGTKDGKAWTGAGCDFVIDIPDQQNAQQGGQQTGSKSFAPTSAQTDYFFGAFLVALIGAMVIGENTLVTA